MIWCARPSEPRIVRDVHQKGRTTSTVIPTQVLEDRLVTNQHTERADAYFKNRSAPANAKRSEESEIEPPRVHERDPLGYRHEVLLVIDRLGVVATERIEQECRVEVVEALAIAVDEMDTAHELCRARFAAYLADHLLPWRMPLKRMWHRSFRPDHEIRSGFGDRASRQSHSIMHDRVHRRRLLLLPESHVRLEQRDFTYPTESERPFTDQPVADGNHHADRYTTHEQQRPALPPPHPR